MKLFWAIIIVFIAAAGFVVYSQSRSREDSTRATTPAPQPQASAFESPLFAPMTSDGAAADDASAADGGDVELDSDSDAARELAADLLASSRQPRLDDGDEEGGEFTDDWPTSAGGGIGGAGGTGKGDDNPWAVEGDVALGDERLAARRLEHSIVKQDDGSLLLDGTFVVRGEGSAANPYEVTWDLLMSAAETYQPRLGMEEVPQRVAMLDGKHVKISGHLMFPMITGQADELLVMLNMWDGCCIGTMPSPYDAVEVQLGTPAPVGRQQFFNYGTIEGKFSVDPYLINDWLIGLYIIDEASLSVGM